MQRREFVRLAAAASACVPCGPLAAASLSSDALAPLDPELRPSAARLLAAASSELPLADASLLSRRAQGAASVAPLLPDVPVSEKLISGASGTPAVQLFVVNGERAGGRPAILHTHGGGHVLGRARWELRYLQELARDLDCVLVTVEYRLAPETNFRGSTQDNYSALRWMHASARQLGIDPARIALLGESAGGTHAALLAIIARDRGEVPVAFQALIYPMLDDRTGSTRRDPGSVRRLVWDSQSNVYGWRSFLGVEPGGPRVPAAAVPARTSRLERLPPTFIAVGGADLFVEEDVEYARRLIAQGVPTELHVVPGAYHAFDRIAPETAIAQRFKALKMDALRRAFAAGRS